jgi:hypothetical protein
VELTDGRRIVYTGHENVPDLGFKGLTLRAGGRSVAGAPQADSEDEFV